MSIFHKSSKLTASLSLSFALAAFTGCGGVTPASSSSASSSSSTSSSNSSSSSSSTSSSTSSSSSSTGKVFPTGNPVSTPSANRGDQRPAFTEQNRAPEDNNPQQPKSETIAKLSNPWGIVFLPDGRMLITEKAGKLKLVTQDGAISDISGVPGNIYYAGTGIAKQAGFFDITISPDFATDRMVYFIYTKQSGGNNQITISKARLSSDSKKLEDLTEIFNHKPALSSDFNLGASLTFAPDGTIYASVGDYYSKQNMKLAQDLNAHVGKVVRINTDGSAPADNPYTSGGGLPEIWSYGHRNIQGTAIHPDTGLLWTMEHGPQGGDEINRPQKGKNYGWPIITYGEDYFGAGPIGDDITKKTGMEQPVYYFDPVVAPAGIAFYKGAMFDSWNGDLLITALKTGGFVRIMLDGEKVLGEQRYFNNGGRFRDIAVGPNGAIWVVIDSGDLRKITLQ